MYRIKVNANQVIDVQAGPEGLLLNQKPFEWDLLELSPHSFHILHQHRSYRVELLKADYEAKSFVVRIGSREYHLQAQDRYDLLLEKMGIGGAQKSALNHIKAPMPGLILEVKVQAGDVVRKGDPLIILEAMKMENIIKSPGDGKVKLVKAQQGKNVEKNQVLIEF
jgi:biotin carboxyl carrier protein